MLVALQIGFSTHIMTAGQRKPNKLPIGQKQLQPAGPNPRLAANAPTPYQIE